MKHLRITTEAPGRFRGNGRNAKQIRFCIAVTLLMTMLVLLPGCGSGPEITITWKSAKPGLENGVLLRYESIDVGRVAQVTSNPDGVTVRARLQAKYAHYIRTKSTFTFRPASAGSGAFIQVIALDKDAPAAPPNAQFAGADSAVDLAVAMVTTNWQRTALFCAVGLGLVLVLLLVIKTLLKLWAVVASLIAGLASAVYLSPFIETHLRAFLPTDIRADLVAYVVGFLIGALLISVVLGIVFKPMRSK